MQQTKVGLNLGVVWELTFQGILILLVRKVFSVLYPSCMLDPFLQHSTNSFPILCCLTLAIKSNLCCLACESSSQSHQVCRAGPRSRQLLGAESSAPALAPISELGARCSLLSSPRSSIRAGVVQHAAAWRRVRVGGSSLHHPRAQAWHRYPLPAQRICSWQMDM